MGMIHVFLWENSLELVIKDQEIMFFFSTFDIASQVSQAHRVSAALSGGRGELLGAFCFPDKKIDLIMNSILVMILHLILMMILMSIFS